MRLLTNTVQLMGNLADPPELRLTTEGTYVANMKLRLFSGASNHQYFHLVAWGKLATQMEQRFRKGSRILVRGELRNRLKTIENVQFYCTEIHVHEYLALEKKVREPVDSSPSFELEVA